MHRAKRKPKRLAAIPKQPGAMVDLRHAIAFDKRDINRNFDYDSEAYAEVKRNLKSSDRIRTVGLGDATRPGADEERKLPG
jgi:hypothetical protein